MTAKDLTPNFIFKYGRIKKPITVRRIIRIKDYSGFYDGDEKILIIPQKGKQFFLSSNTPIFKYEPFLYITDKQNPDTCTQKI